MRARSRVSDKSTTAEKLTGIGFVLIAFAAVFITMHKEDIEKGQFMEVVASYFEAKE